ncbi:MAG: rod shape-determining protein, partial [Alphaproteobacteria bacterium]|nr:rod shape-determining protein [Alphaproteobacteria bacterium]
RGRSMAEGVPKTFTINSQEIQKALSDPLSGIVSAVKAALEQTPPELSSDIAERGIVLTGGGALLGNMDYVLRHATGLPVSIADDPLTCVVHGTGRALEEFKRLKDVLVSMY